MRLSLIIASESNSFFLINLRERVCACLPICLCGVCPFFSHLIYPIDRHVTSFEARARDGDVERDDDREGTGG